MSLFFVFWWISVTFLVISLVGSICAKSLKEVWSTGVLILIVLAFGGEVYMHDKTKVKLETALDQVNELKIERDREIIRDTWR